MDLKRTPQGKRDFAGMRRKKDKDWDWAFELFSVYCGETLAESMVLRELAAGGTGKGPKDCAVRIRELRGKLLMFMEEEEFDDILTRIESRDIAAGEGDAG